MFGLLDFNRDGSESPTPEVNGTFPEYFYSETHYYDFNNDGWLSDDERDEDSDGLTNYDETHGRMLPEFWKGCYTGEQPYGVVYAGTNVIDPDSDGDGVIDGADDQDHDDVPNVMELSRNQASGEWDAEDYCKALDSLPTPPAELHPGNFTGASTPSIPACPRSTLGPAPCIRASAAAAARRSTARSNWVSLN